MRINDEYIISEDNLRQGIASAFESLLLDFGDWRANPMGLNFAKVNVQEAKNLEIPFSEIDVFKALNDLNRDKTPRLDGYMVAFWQKKLGYS